MGTGVPWFRNKDVAGGVFSGVLLFLFTSWFVWTFHKQLTQIVPLGALCLGIVFGWVLRFFINRMSQFNSKELTAIIVAMIGATVVTFFKPVANEGHDFFFYPVGVAVGFFAAQVWNLFALPPRDGS